MDCFLECLVEWVSLTVASLTGIGLIVSIYIQVKASRDTHHSNLFDMYTKAFTDRINKLEKKLKNHILTEAEKKSILKQIEGSRTSLEGMQEFILKKQISRGPQIPKLRFLKEFLSKLKM